LRLHRHAQLLAHRRQPLGGFGSSRVDLRLPFRCRFRNTFQVGLISAQ
jgi:hypothetical protein